MDDEREVADLPDVVTVRGSAEGPTVAILGGVHGDELEGVLAARRVVRLLTPSTLRGTVRVAAPAHPAAWRAVSRTSPVDGRNLAREFPGDPGGSASQRVAAFLTTEVIAGADMLIDLHSAGEGFDMPLLAGYHAGPGPVCDRSGAAAAVFGAPYLWQHPQASSGRSLSAAAELGVPSLYVEGRGGGQVRQTDLDCYVGGVLRVLQHLGMVEVAPPAGPSVVVRGDGNTDGGVQAPAAGYLTTSVEVGQQVVAGEPLGQVVDEHGTPVSAVLSPRSGVVMLTRRRARVAVGDTVAIVAELLAARTAEGAGTT